MKRNLTSPVILIIVFLSLFRVALVSAQAESQGSIDTLFVPFKPGYGIGLGAGLFALPSVDVAAQLTPFLGVSIGYEGFSIEQNNLSVSTADLGISDESFLIDSKFNVQLLPVVAHLSVPKLAWLRLRLGAAIPIKEEYSGVARLEDGITFNDVKIGADKAGELQLEVIDGPSVMPHVGLALGRLVPKKRVNVSGHFGAYYRGEPTITVTGTGLLEGNDANGPVLSENFSDLAWLPSAQLRIAVRF